MPQPLLAQEGSALTGPAADAASAEAEAARLSAAAEALRQRAVALRQLEAADRALAATRVQVPPTPPPPTSAVTVPATGTTQTPAAGRAISGVTRNTNIVEGGGGDAANGITRSFGGIKFGVGISFTLDVGTSDRVREAQLVNGIVRVTDERNGIARIMLVMNHLFTPGYDPTPSATQIQNGPFGTSAGLWGHGPFVAVQPGQGDVIDAFALGWMIGFRRSLTTTESLNFGLGVVVDPNTRILGDGIVANQPLPLGETEIRYRNEMQTGILFLTSFSF